MTHLKILIKIVLPIGLSFMLFACGGGNGNDDTATDTTAQVEGILLEGDPQTLGVTAVRDFDAGDRTTADEISVSADGMRIDRTNIEISFIPTATVEDINTLLDSIDGKIVNMMQDVNVILVKIPDPGDLVSLFAIINQVKGDPVVDDVLEADMLEDDSLPGNYDPAVTDLTRIDHHIAVLAPAAWNARAAIDYPVFAEPLLLQRDSFGDGMPNGDFNANTLDGSDFGTGQTKTFKNGTVGPHQHGAHVLGIMVGRHTVDATKTTNRDLVTGMYPVTLDLRVADTTVLNRSASELKVTKIIKASVRRVVVNTSKHSGCPRPPQSACVIPRTFSWLKKIRGSFDFYRGAKSQIEKFYIHLASAGNFRFPPTIDSRTASLNSQYTAAKMFPGILLATIPPTPIPNVSNTLVVENRMNAAAAPFNPGCLSVSSKFPGEISAIGGNVWSYTGVRIGQGNLTGTSMSTPQVAGLAAYIWALEPMLTPEQIIAILTTTARQMPGDAACATTAPNTVPTPVIDAYAAVLAVDEAKVINPIPAHPLEAPARLAIFDVVNDAGSAGANRVFDEDDIARFVIALNAGSGMLRDYSRFDLNGDGFTGGTDKRARFNLDIDAAQVYGAVMQDIEGNMVSYDENLATDWEILCYYAYSTFYNGTADGRSTALGTSLAKCGVLGDSILFMRGHDENKEIYSMDSDGNNQKNLTNNLLIQDDIYLPAFSPDQTKIVFETDRDGDSEVYVMDSNGMNLINLSNHGSFDRFPAWSSDGSKVIFISGRDGVSEIYEVDALGSTTPQRITFDSLSKSFPRWSPDGAQIMFQGRGGANISNIYTMEATGGEALNLSAGLGHGSGAKWSPDGTRILFLSRSDPADFTTEEVYVVSANGSGSPLRITDNIFWDSAASWSPDSSKIAFTSDRDGNGEIYVVNADGSSAAINLTNNPGQDRYPYWTSDGEKIYFERPVEFISDIFIMDADGNSPPINLTNNPEEDSLLNT